MTSVPAAQDRAGLRDVAAPHARVLAALDDPDTNSLAAVTWASTHLAAVERVLHPVAARLLPDGAARVRSQRAADHRLQQALWRLDRRLTGDLHLASASVPALEDAVRRGLAEHADGERDLVADLREALAPDGERALGELLDAAVRRAPTRPHPDTRHGRHGGALSFWSESVVDRVRDGLDCREVPTPHAVPVPLPLGRWGAYLMGVPYGRSTPGR